jgi:AcrR family transcriptional regulator
VGRHTAPAERQAIEAIDPAQPDRPLRADAVRNRERLLAAAAAAFAANGAEVPLEDIAREAGVGIGTLYRHFPTRESLVEAVYRHEVDVLCAAADDLLATRPADQALAAWMQLFVQHVATKRGMLSVLKPMMSSDPALSAATRGRAVDAASRLLAAGVAAGTVRADIQGADLVRAVGGICMSTDQERSEASERLVGLLFDGLRHGANAAPSLATAGHAGDGSA